MLDYLLKAQEITILDMIIVAVAASIIAPVTMYAVSWIVRKTWSFIRGRIRKRKEAIEKKRKLQNGEISVKTWRDLKVKQKEGTITELEEQALRIADDRMKESAQKISVSAEKINDHANRSLRDLERFK